MPSEALQCVIYSHVPIQINREVENLWLVYPRKQGNGGFITNEIINTWCTFNIPAQARNIDRVSWWTGLKLKHRRIYSWENS